MVFGVGCRASRVESERLLTSTLRNPFTVYLHPPEPNLTTNVDALWVFATPFGRAGAEAGAGVAPDNVSSSDEPSCMVGLEGGGWRGG